MTTQMLQSFFMWCSIINIVLLMVVFFMITTAKEWGLQNTQPLVQHLKRTLRPRALLLPRPLQTAGLGLLPHPLDRPQHHRLNPMR